MHPMDYFFPKIKVKYPARFVVHSKENMNVLQTHTGVGGVVKNRNGGVFGDSKHPDKSKTVKALTVILCVKQCALLLMLVENVITNKKKPLQLHSRVF